MPLVNKEKPQSRQVAYLLHGTEGEQREPANVGYFHRADRLREEAEARGWKSVVKYDRRDPADRSAIRRMLRSSWLLEAFKDCRCVYTAGATTAAMAAWAMRNSHTPVLYDIHTPPVGEKWLQFRLAKSLRNFVVYLEACLTESVAIKRSDYILWSSLVQREYYMRRGFRHDRLREVRHGVDIGRFNSGPVPNSRPRLLVYAGTMVPYQGADKLVEAFAAMPKGDLRLRMIGFTDKEKGLRDMADRAGIETMPQIPQSDVADAMKDAHCTTIIAHRDNKKYKNGAAPTKWPESLALGRPILSMDVYDTALMIPQLKVGWVVENSVEGLVFGMSSLRDCSIEELQAMGQRAREEASRNYAWPVIGDKFSNIIEEAARK